MVSREFSPIDKLGLFSSQRWKFSSSLLKTLSPHNQINSLNQWNKSLHCLCFSIINVRFSLIISRLRIPMIAKTRFYKDYCNVCLPAHTGRKDAALIHIPLRSICYCNDIICPAIWDRTSFGQICCSIVGAFFIVSKIFIFPWRNLFA